MSEEKLSKKQRKALEFKNKTAEERKEDQAEKVEKKRKLEEEEAAKVPKKRKTRRGKKGKGQSNAAGGPRFILFVGNLPYDVSQTELVTHFKCCSPDNIRIRQDKGIAFLEFSKDHQDIQSKMDLALRMHHLTLRNRKINVELTVGGGGNSEDRIEKIKLKNVKMNEERTIRIKEGIKKAKKEAREKELLAAPRTAAAAVHPDRAKLLH